jgi:DNA-directed RNA polymerase specialized sigma24 family protein
VLHSLTELEQSDPTVQVEVKDALQRALDLLTDDERYVILATLQYGFTYRETAELRFGDATETKRVDRLLQTARAKLREVHQAWIEGT